MCKKLISSFLFFSLICLNNMGLSVEKNCMGMAYVDKEPWKMAWINDKQLGWHFTTAFEKCIVTYFFKNGPISDKGLNIDRHNLPYKIELKHLLSSETFTIKNIDYEQWDDGAKAIAGEYKGKFKIGTEKFAAITVSLVQEVNGAKDYANYSLWKDL